MKHPESGWQAAALAWLVVLLTACGGGSSSDPGAKAQAVSVVVAGAQSAASGNGGGALPGPDPGLLLMLIPDSVQSSDPRIAAWVDAAVEIGVRLTAVTDTQFLSLGSSEALKYAGLVLPDDLHSIASDTLGRVNTNSYCSDCDGHSRAWKSHPSSSPRLSTVFQSNVATSA